PAGELWRRALSDLVPQHGGGRPSGHRDRGRLARVGARGAALSRVRVALGGGLVDARRRAAGAADRRACLSGNGRENSRGDLAGAEMTEPFRRCAFATAAIAGAIAWATAALAQAPLPTPRSVRITMEA